MYVYFFQVASLLHVSPPKHSMHLSSSTSCHIIRTAHYSRFEYPDSIWCEDTVPNSSWKHPKEALQILANKGQWFCPLVTLQTCGNHKFILSIQCAYVTWMLIGVLPCSVYLYVASYTTYEETRTYLQSCSVRILSFRRTLASITGSNVARSTSALLGCTNCVNGIPGRGLVKGKEVNVSVHARFLHVFINSNSYPWYNSDRRSFLLSVPSSFAPSSLLYVFFLCPLLVISFYHSFFFFFPNFVNIFLIIFLFTSTFPYHHIKHTRRY